MRAFVALHHGDRHGQERGGHGVEDVPGNPAAAHTDDDDALDVLASAEARKSSAQRLEGLLHLFGEGLRQLEHPVGVN